MRYVLGCVHPARKMTGGGFDEPVEPPIEKPEEPEKPTTPPSIEDLRTIKINDEIMAVVGTKTWRSIAYGNGIYVVVGLDGYTAYSTDGENWTRKTVGTESWYAIAFGNGKFVAVGKSRKITTTTDGKTWTTVKQVGTSAVGNWLAITYADGKFITSSSKGYGAISIDGVNWTNMRIASDYTWSLSTIAYGNGRFIASGMSNTYKSTDGETWVKCANHVACNAMTYGAGKFVSVHIESGAYSTDNGETWTDVPITGGSYNWLGITYANGLFVAGGQDGYITTSIDGVTWSQPVQVIPKGTGTTNDNAIYDIVKMN